MRLNLESMSSREIGFPKFRRQNPNPTGMEYSYRQPAHDYYGVTVATAVTRQTLFALGTGAQYTPAGGAAFAKSAWHTNVPQPGGQFPKPNWMVVRAISISLDPRTWGADGNRRLFQTYVTFIIIDRPYLETHAWKLPSGGGAWAGGSAGSFGNGEPHRNNQFLFEGKGERIDPQQNFSVTLDPTISTLADATGVLTTAAAAAGGVGINALVHLDGLFRRMVT